MGDLFLMREVPLQGTPTRRTTLSQGKATWSAPPSKKVDVRLPGKGDSNYQAGPPNHRDDKVDSDQ